MWSSLIPLILGSALEPIEIGITIMLLGTPSHLRAAGAWLAGHGSTRLLQGLIFGTILHWGARSADSNRSHHWIVSTVLLVVALLFLVTAARELFSDDDPNAPPPKWMTMLMSATPAKAFFIGAGVITVSVKAWVFTLAAISVIGNADLGRVGNVVSYVAFVLLAMSANLLIVGMAALFGERSRSPAGPDLALAAGEQPTHHDRCGAGFRDLVWDQGPARLWDLVNDPFQPRVASWPCGFAIPVGGAADPDAAAGGHGRRGGKGVRCRQAANRGIARFRSGTHTRRRDRRGTLRTHRGNHAAQWRSIRRVIDEHGRTDNRWLEYELDFAKLLDFPLMTDMRDPLTIGFHKAKLRADFLRPVKAEDLLDDRDAAAQYQAAVEDYVTAFNVAEAEAIRRRRNDFSPDDQQRIARAQRLLRVASDSAAAQQERQNAYDLAGKELDGLIVLPSTTQASIERGISGQLER